MSAAVTLADDEGLDAFSMRHVAERLGIGVMTLYTYVPDRNALLGLVRERGRCGRRTRTAHGGVRERLTQVADDLWREYLHHPWLIDLQIGRPFMGPGEAERYEWQVRAVDGVGLSDLQMDQVVTALTSYVAGAARARVVAERSRTASGMTDLEWWDVNAPILDEVMRDGD